MIRQRNEAAAAVIMCQLQDRTGPGNGCLRQVDDARRRLLAEGAEHCPDWRDIAAGVRPPPPDLQEPGEWAHG